MYPYRISVDEICGHKRRQAAEIPPSGHCRAASKYEFSREVPVYPQTKVRSRTVTLALMLVVGVYMMIVKTHIRGFVLVFAVASVDLLHARSSLP